MEQNIREEKTAATWYYGATIVAILFSFVLFRFDEYLTNTPRDKILGQTLDELRVAQSTVGVATAVDPRQAEHRFDAPHSQK